MSLHWEYHTFRLQELPQSLHDWRLHDLVQEVALHPPALFCVVLSDANVGVVAVHDGDELGEGGSSQFVLFDRGEESECGRYG